MKLVTDEDNELVRRLNQAPQDVPFARAVEDAPKPTFIPSPSSRYDDAIAKYKVELQARKDDPDLLNYLGYAQLKRGDIKEAISNLEQAVKVSKVGTWAKYNLALAYLAASRNSDAIVQVSELVAKAPEFKGIISRDKQFFEYLQKIEGLSRLVQ